MIRPRLSQAYKRHLFDLAERATYLPTRDSCISSSSMFERSRQKKRRSLRVTFFCVATCHPQQSINHFIIIIIIMMKILTLFILWTLSATAAEETPTDFGGYLSKSPGVLGVSEER